MRLEVILPDHVYTRAERLATHNGLSIERFVVDAVRKHLKAEEAISLTPEQIAKVRAAQEDVKAGRVYTLEQVRANLDAHKEAWLAENPH